MATVEIDLDVPEGVRIRGYERVGDGHAFELDWELPESTTCEKCRRRHKTCVKHGDKIQVIRDLDVWGQPAFFVYQPPLHRCPWLNKRGAITGSGCCRRSSASTSRTRCGSNSTCCGC